jgi:CheY-like chemotaxis protein
VANDRIDAVVTDVMMPGINGSQLAQLIREVKPKMPIVCVTGYAFVPDDARHCDMLLQKPYGAAAIAKTLKSLLAA